MAVVQGNAIRLAVHAVSMRVEDSVLIQKKTRMIRVTTSSGDQTNSCALHSGTLLPDSVRRRLEPLIPRYDLWLFWITLDAADRNEEKSLTPEMVCNPSLTAWGLSGRTIRSLVRPAPQCVGTRSNPLSEAHSIALIKG
jgi:hypothetical protein